ncbi:S46 family peptidase [Bacteroides sp.]|uniref:S46 family peptidase n=1 Tax=Bacteroides sp. TaxID=29523 RepID=UPI001B775D84|nr:S46 family peptidase [Bacteroides sp.]MBP6065023.1 S46 family peptidase [Bacteroides sp.]MBP6935531.1 S46 family peptidase [Bacteroides sp.]MBP8621640.1 S46 family peptidase [Bacteroides sp.]MBP9586770.1 S46 family peptidase [Bacteroides sp.]
MNIRIIAIIALLFSSSLLRADEGMWLLGNLNKQTRQAMKELGLQLPVEKLYNPKKPCLADAVVSFGGFCSGVVVSDDGLVFTNHHCGFSSVQQHSSVEHDYLKDGFVARNRNEELPNPELYVRFLLRTENVTKRVLKATKPSMTESERRVAVDSLMLLIGNEVGDRDSTLVGVVDTYYAGNEFWLSVYRDFNDVRLVFAPPSSIGKFGWDTDNWVWPRHTGDFCVFRIYADKNNQPANYSPDNIPYKASYVAPISLDGYKEGSFCMTLGYPGQTERFLSSFGVEERMGGMNQAMIDVRGVKQAIWKREMDRRPDIRIKYASKYDESSNYWKNSIGMNKAIRELSVLEKKRTAEATLRQWIQRTPSEREKLLHLFSSLELNYKDRREVNRAMAYFGESFINGPELIQLALEILNFDFEAESQQVTLRLEKLLDKYANFDLSIDKEVFVALLKEYRSKVDTRYLPPLYQAIDSAYGGNEHAYVDSLYAQTQIATPRGLQRFLERDTTYHLLEDPAIALGIDLIVKYYDMNHATSTASEEIERGERLMSDALRRMKVDYNFYPDANSTLRLSFGTVGGYSPFDGAAYDYYTTVKGIFEKVQEHQGDPDFAIQPELLSLFASGNFGRYADEKGEMNVCFISNNDITGGNSGSAMFNARGELLGLAFDGNWEAMSGDIVFEPDLQRCIGVDVRYMLFIIEKYGKAGELIKELKLNASK